jgi:hypothetical protein
MEMIYRLPLNSRLARVHTMHFSLQRNMVPCYGPPSLTEVQDTAVTDRAAINDGESEFPYSGYSMRRQESAGGAYRAESLIQRLEER